MESQREDHRPTPAKVYPAVPDTQGWVVEAPPSGTLAGGELKTFTGTVALSQALEYAYRTYGAASCFSGRSLLREPW